MSFEKINSRDTRPKARTFRGLPPSSVLSNETRAFMNRSEASSSRILRSNESEQLHPLPGRVLHPRLKDADSNTSLKDLPKISGVEPRQLLLLVENFRR